MYVFNISTNGITIWSHIEELQSFNTFYHIIKSEKKIYWYSANGTNTSESEMPYEMTSILNLKNFYKYCKSLLTIVQDGGIAT